MINITITGQHIQQTLTPKLIHFMQVLGAHSGTASDVLPKWCKVFCKGSYSWTFRNSNGQWGADLVFSFSKITDAILFKLTWG